MTWTCLVIVGPTAAGKTGLSLDLAEALAARSSPPTPARSTAAWTSARPRPRRPSAPRVPHHLIDVVDPDQVLTLAEYQALAYRAIEEIAARGRLPMLVGGTGQYVAAVLEGWRIPEVAPQPGAPRRARSRGGRARAARRCTPGWPASTPSRPRASTTAMCAASSGRSRSALPPGSPSASCSARSRRRTRSSRSA